MVHDSVKGGGINVVVGRAGAAATEALPASEKAFARPSVEGPVRHLLTQSTSTCALTNLLTVIAAREKKR